MENQDISLYQFVSNWKPSPSSTQSHLIHKILCLVYLLIFIFQSNHHIILLQMQMAELFRKTLARKKCLSKCLQIHLGCFEKERTEQVWWKVSLTSQNPPVTCEGSIVLTKLGNSGARFAWASFARSKTEARASALWHMLSAVALFRLLL